MITYSPANPDDAESLTQFALESNSFYRYRTVSDEEARQVFILRKEDFLTSFVALMKLNNELIGFYSLKAKKPQELGHLFLKPSHIYQGFGVLLFNKAMDHAKSLGWEKLEWESDPNAAKFYEKMGAKLIGKNPCRLNPNYESPVFRFEL